jgi:hypothetical protein
MYPLLGKIGFRNRGDLLQPDILELHSRKLGPL